MPASSSTVTSSQRLARAEPGTFVCGNSSTAQISGRRARIASVSISSNAWPRYSTQRRGTTSRPSIFAMVSCSPVRLEVADDDVVTRPLELLRLVEHPEGLARRPRRSPGRPSGGLAAGPPGGVAHCRGNTRTSMPSASRISRSTRLVRRRDVQPRSWTVAHEDLGDAVPAREVQDRAHRVAALEDLDPCARPREPASRFWSSTAWSARAQALLPDVDDVQVAVEAVGLPSPAADHQRRVRARRDADEDALVGAVDLLDSRAAQVVRELVVDHLRGQQQRDLAQLGELALQPRPRRASTRRRPRVGSRSTRAGRRRSRSRRRCAGTTPERSPGPTGPGSPRPGPVSPATNWRLTEVIDGDAGREQVLDVLPAVRMS